MKFTYIFLSTLFLAVGPHVSAQQSKKSIEAQTLNMPWEEEYGYAQAVRKGNTVWISGQLGHDAKGVLAVGMEEQMKLTYQNARRLLEGFGMSLDNVVEEVIYVLDMKTAFEARKLCGRQFYSNRRQVASSIVEIDGLALPGQLVEIKFIAVK